MKSMVASLCFLFACVLNVTGQVFVSCKSMPGKVKFAYVNAIDENLFVNKQVRTYPIIKGLVKKRDNSLVINTRNGKSVSFIDKMNSQDDASQRVYEYIGVISKLNVYIVKEIEYEWSNYIIVNANDGACVRLWSLPYVSPDGEKILAYAANLIYDPMPNGIQVISIHQGVFKCVTEYVAEDWEPSAVAWRDNTSIYIKKRVPAVLNNSKKDVIGYGVMIIK